MSADKRKRWNRAMEYLRGLHAHHYRPGEAYHSGWKGWNRQRVATERYCLERGLLVRKTIRWSRACAGYTIRRTVFVDPDR